MTKKRIDKKYVPNYVERTQSRDTEIHQRRLNGETLQSIADNYGISRERVRQIFSSETKKLNRLFGHNND